MRIAFGIAACVLVARAAHASPPPELDARHAATLAIGMAGIEFADDGKIADPIAHGIFAWVTPPLELELVADWAAIGDATGADDPYTPRRLVRAGSALRWDFALLDHGNPDVDVMFYADLGMGWEHATNARMSADRGDLEAGAGTELMFLHDGHARYGIDFALRGFAAPATEGFARLECKATCMPAGRGVDIGLMFDMGVVIRR